MGRVRADGAVRRGDRERFRDRPATPAGFYDGPSAVSAGGVSPCAPAETTDGVAEYERQRDGGR